MSEDTETLKMQSYEAMQRIKDLIYGSITMENNERRDFKMSQEDMETLLEAARPTPMIMLQCGPPTSPQERANAAWKKLGDKMGFQHMTVKPKTGWGPEYFTAVPK